jgi:hypothetical protein
MDQVLKGLLFAQCYIYDVIIFNHTPKEHVKHLQQVLECLQALEPHLHHGKCKFFHGRFAYLGHMFTLGD